MKPWLAWNVLCMYVLYARECSALEARRGCQIPWTGGYGPSSKSTEDSIICKSIELS